MPTASRILVTDNDTSVLEFLSSALRTDGHEVTTATSGAETVSRVNEFHPDLILLDMKFPPCSENHQSTLEDGLLIIAWLRGMSQAAKIPIIVISGTDPAEYMDRALAMGVAAIFQKPLEVNRLLKVIRATLDNRQQSDQKDRGRPASAGNDDPAGLNSKCGEPADIQNPS
jgi:DNA-binding response OmpR family regulator